MNLAQFQTRAFISAARYLRPTRFVTMLVSTAASVRLGYVVAASGKGQDETALAAGITMFLLMIPALMQADHYAFELASKELDNERVRIEVLKPQPFSVPNLNEGGWRAVAASYITEAEADGSVSLYNSTLRINMTQLDWLYRLVHDCEKTGRPPILRHREMTGPRDYAFKQGEDYAFLRGLDIEHLTYKRGKSDCLTPRGMHIIRKTWGLAYPKGKVYPA